MLRQDKEEIPKLQSTGLVEARLFTLFFRLAQAYVWTKTKGFLSTLKFLRSLQSRGRTHSRMHAECSACRMLQNVLECMQNVLECSRMHAEHSRMHAKCFRMFKNGECSRKFQNACRMFHTNELACRSMSLHAVT